MKKLLMLTILLSGLVFPWACSDNNTPSKPPNLGLSTPSGTLTPGTPTNTPTLAAGAPTFTPTATFSLPVPAFQNNYSTSASPHGMSLNGGILTVAESEVTLGGRISDIEEFTGGGTASLNLYTASGPNISDAVLTGCPPIPTPGATPVLFIPVTTGLQQVQGFVNPGGNNPGAWSAVLDIEGSGAALYAGYYGFWTSPTPPQGSGYMPFICNGYGGVNFNNPQNMTADQTGPTGNIYITDTGNGVVDDFSPYTGPCPVGALQVHQWFGDAGATIGGPIAGLGGKTVTFNSPAIAFKSPYGVACDPNNNVWVTDTGYGPSYVMQFNSTATTILESWQCIPGCIAHGVAADNSANCTGVFGAGPCVYVADSGNNLIEVYSYSGNLMTEFGDPGPGAHEFAPFSPSCIAFSGGYIYVGDISNNFIDVFH